MTVPKTKLVSFAALKFICHLPETIAWRPLCWRKCQARYCPKWQALLPETEMPLPATAEPERKEDPIAEQLR